MAIIKTGKCRGGIHPHVSPSVIPKQLFFPILYDDKDLHRCLAVYSIASLDANLESPRQALRLPPPRDCLNGLARKLTHDGHWRGSNTEE
ncbi:hypothetical protein J2T60_001188 [Natronospira proteinivora]|uniref:Uncharacterized protein n=1 Tax=Natronospira proteinivora TaxID=1807133 RepID=A0ABT1GAE6_9GAMM|nr:hypothetical protein [Natronospira proteinivora]